MITRIEGLSESDKILEDELIRCTDAYRCWRIAEEAENPNLAMEANRKCIRLYREEEYSAGLL